MSHKAGDYIYPGSEYTDEERIAMMHVERRKREEHKPFPHMTDVLRWLKELGYAKEDTHVTQFREETKYAD